MVTLHLIKYRKRRHLPPLRTPTAIKHEDLGLVEGRGYVTRFTFPDGSQKENETSPDVPNPVEFRYVSDMDFLYTLGYRGFKNMRIE